MSKGAAIVVGATSSIGAAVARELAARGHALVLGARDEDELERLASDLALRSGARVVSRKFEAADFSSHAAFFDEATRAFPEGVEGIVVCHGALAPSGKLDADAIRGVVDVNFTSCVTLLETAATYFEARRSGFVCAVTSVAGDRGRQSNYLYGSAKAGLSVYLQGLRNRLFPAGVSVVDVKPGFVDTSMTFGLPKLFLVASPARVARDIARAIVRRRNSLYTPWFWRYIMAIIRGIPEPIFKRMKL